MDRRDRFRLTHDEVGLSGASYSSSKKSSGTRAETLTLGDVFDGTGGEEEDGARATTLDPRLWCGRSAFVTREQQRTYPRDETLVEALEPSTVESLADRIPQAVVSVRGEVSLENFEGL